MIGFLLVYSGYHSYLLLQTRIHLEGGLGVCFYLIRRLLFALNFLILLREFHNDCFATHGSICSLHMASFYFLLNTSKKILLYGLF